MKELGIYVHIPFCKQKCYYCDFVSYCNKDALIEEYIKALIKEMQRDPATNKIIHLDLEEVSDGEKVISTVPIHYIGEEYINKKGIVLQKEKDSVKVEGNVDSLPKYLNINIGTGTVGDVYKFGDLEIGSEISIVDDLNSVIASVIYERKRVADDMEMAAEENES